MLNKSRRGIIASPVFFLYRCMLGVCGGCSVTYIHCKMRICPLYDRSGYYLLNLRKQKKNLNSISSGSFSNCFLQLFTICFNNVFIPSKRVLFITLHAAVSFIITVHINHTIAFFHFSCCEGNDINDSPRSITN